MPSADQVPVNNPHSKMQWHKWVVLIAGSTGSALRAVRPPNSHITPDVDAISFTPQVQQVLYSVRPWPSWPKPFWRSCWRVRSRELAVNRDCLISSLGSADTAQTRRSKIRNSLRPSVAIGRHSQYIHRQFGKHQLASALISSYHNVDT